MVRMLDCINLAHGMYIRGHIGALNLEQGVRRIPCICSKHQLAYVLQQASSRSNDHRETIIWGTTTEEVHTDH